MYNLVIRCVYHLKPRPRLTVIKNKEDLHFFLTSSDVSESPLYVSQLLLENVIPTLSFAVDVLHNFPPLAPIHSSADSVNKDIVGSLSSLNNVIPTELGDDSDLLFNVHEVEEEVEEEEVEEDDVDDDDEVEDGVISEKKRKHIEETMVKAIVVTAESMIEDVDVGNRFVEKKEFAKKMSVIAIKHNFQYRVYRSTKKLYVLRCMDSTCKWKLRAMKTEGSDMFKVNKYVNSHTCKKIIRKQDHKQAKRLVIADLIKSKYHDISRKYRPKEIIQDFRKEYGVDISYVKAWRAREAALSLARGSPKELYRLLARFGEALKIANPGTHYELETDADGHFKYSYMSLGAAIRGFLNCVR